MNTHTCYSFCKIIIIIPIFRWGNFPRCPWQQVAKPVFKLRSICHKSPLSVVSCGVATRFVLDWFIMLKCICCLNFTAYDKVFSPHELNILHNFPILVHLTFYVTCGWSFDYLVRIWLVYSTKELLESRNYCLDIYISALVTVTSYSRYYINNSLICGLVQLLSYSYLLNLQALSLIIRSTKYLLGPYCDSHWTYSNKYRPSGMFRTEGLQPGKPQADMLLVEGVKVKMN